mmetsp:Transcript_34564/g.55700  ORF Transcript_34564/g.55700 Transcript_34564/m.55700 type:complete len:340 (-) Transcript_34564:114-1133(-)
MGTKSFSTARLLIVRILSQPGSTVTTQTIISGPNSVFVEFPKPKEPEPVVWILRDVNYSDLRQIRGISAKIARRIRQVVLRTVFKDWKDLEKRTRIKPKGLAALMQHVKTKMPKPPEPKDIRYKWHCVVCKVDWCARCKIKWHDGETCLDIKLKDKFKESELEMMKLVREGKLFKCECGKFIEKAEGCKYMKCSCGRFFCWACKTLLTADHQDHKCKINGMYMPEEEARGFAAPVVAHRPPVHDPLAAMHRLRPTFGPPHPMGFGDLVARLRDVIHRGPDIRPEMHRGFRIPVHPWPRADPGEILIPPPAPLGRHGWWPPPHRRPPHRRPPHTSHRGPR